MSDNRKAQLGFAVDGSEVKPGLEQIKGDVRAMAQDVAKSGQDAARGITAIGDSAPAAAQKVDGATRSMIQSIQRTTAAHEAGERGTARFYESLAKQRGVSADMLRPYLDQLRQAEAAQAAAGKSLGGMQMSAAQTAAALRQVPAQFTDIFVSLQSGQAPLTVLLQQGGQLKDMFGGIGPAARAMGGYVMGLVSPLALAAVGFGALAFALAKAESSLGASNSIAVQLEATGRSADLSRGYIKHLTQELQLLPDVSRAAAKAIVQEFVNAREIGGELFGSLALTVADFAAATGRTAPAAAKVLAEAFNDPIRGAKKLDEELGLLTASQYVAINAFAAVGDKAGAQGVLLEALKASTKGLAEQAMTPLGASIDHLGNAWEKTMANMEKTGSLNAVNAMIGGVIDKVAELVEWLGRARLPPWLEESFKGGLNGAVYRAFASPNAPKTPSTGSASGSWSDNTGAASGSWGPPVTQQDDQIKNLLELTKGYKSNASAMAEVRKQGDLLRESLKQLQAQGKGNSAEAVELQSRLVGVQERLRSMSHKDSGSAGAGQTEVAGIQGRIDAERAYLELLREQGPAALKLTDAEKQVYRIRRELQTDMTGQTRAQKELSLAKAEELASLERERTALERTISGLEKSKEAYAALVDETHKTALAIGAQADQMESANAMWGKSKVAIEAYKLAVIQAKIAEVEGGSDSSYDPAYVAQLRLQAANQERVLNAARIADYKQISEKQAEWARQVAEEGELYRDEIGLLGLTAREREKVVAVRKVEVELAKKLAEIERSGATDEDKQAASDVARAIAEQAKATAVAKADLAAMVDIVNSIDHTAQQVWTNVFEGGSGAFKKLGQTLKASVLDLLYQLVLKRWVVSISANIVQSLGGSVAGALGGSGAGGGFGNLGSLGSVLQALTGSTVGASSASLLYSNAVSMAGGDGLGALIAANGNWAGVGVGAAAEAGAAAGAAAAAEAGAAAGASAGASAGATAGSSFLSAIPGWGWAALAGVALLGSLVKDDSGTLHTGGMAEYSKDKGLKTSVERGDFGLNIGMVLGEQTQKAVSDVSQSVAKTLDSISKAFGGKGGYEVATGFADDTSRDGAWGALRIALGGKDLLNWNDTQKGKWAAREFADGEQGWKEYLQAVATDTKKVLDDMDLPGWADDLLKSLGDSPNIEALAGVVQQIEAGAKAFEALGKHITGFAEMTDEARTALVRELGGADKVANEYGSFQQNYYSADERKAAKERDIRDALDEVGLVMPKTREEYRKMVEAQMALGESGSKALAVLLQFDEAFADITPAAEGATSSVKSIGEQIKQSLGFSGDGLASLLKDAVKGASSQEEASRNASSAFQQQIYDGLFDSMTKGVGDMLMQAVVGPMVESLVMGGNVASMSMATGGIAAATGMATGGAVAGAGVATGGAMGGAASASGGAAAGSAMAAGGASAAAALVAGGSAAGSQVADVVERARQYMASFTAIMKDPGIRDMFSDVGDLVGNVAGELWKTKGTFYQDQAFVGGAASGMSSAMQDAGKAMKGLTDTVINEIKRLRGVMVDESPVARDVLLARFATATAQSRAGDKDALEKLPQLSQAIEAATKLSATSSIELARTRGWLAASLEETLKQLGVKLPAFAVGTNYVPRDMVALLHAGEAVVPKAYNPAAGAMPATGVPLFTPPSYQAGDSEVVRELQQLRSQVDRLALQNEELALDAQRLRLRLAQSQERTEALTAEIGEKMV